MDQYIITHIMCGEDVITEEHKSVNRNSEAPAENILRSVARAGQSDSGRWRWGSGGQR